jgi:multicomponent Na+:H+ antiporter subunit D
MSDLLGSVAALPVLVPLVAAGVSIAAGRSRAAQRVVSVCALIAVVTVTAILVVGVDRHGTTVVHAGGWQSPVGITLVVDRLAALLLLTAAVTLLAVLVFAIGQPGAEDRHVGFHPAYLILTAGVALAFVTGDLFNLFVAFEVMLTASYVLITLGGGAEQVRAGMTYVVISLVASTLFLLALAFVYLAAGTVDLADLSGKIATLPPGVRSALAVLLIAVFGIKAAIFPLFFWLPDSYPTAPAPVTAVFAGLLTKVGVYALIRTQTLLFPPSTRPQTLLLIVAGLTMVVGVLGAIVQNDIKRILSFHIVSQIGYMVMGLALFTVAGVAGAILFVVHQIVVKAALFLVEGLIEQRAGHGELDRLSALARLEPLIALLFGLAALSLAGLPPFSGFVAKLALTDAGLSARSYSIVGVSLAVSLLTLYSMVKIWSNAFWGPVGAGEELPPRPQRRALMTGATAGLVVVSLAVTVFAGPLTEYTRRAAHDLLNTGDYVAAVRRR